MVSVLTAFASVLHAESTAPAPSSAPAFTISAPTAHDWTGWYGDVFVGHWNTPKVGNYFGGDVGYNLSNSSVVYGGELSAIYDPSLDLTGVSLAGRAGINTKDDLLLFIRLGVGFYNVAIPSAVNMEYGIGSQISVTDNMYFRGDLLALTPMDGSATATQIRAGSGWEF